MNHRLPLVLLTYAACLAAPIVPVAGQAADGPSGDARLFVLPEHDLYPESIAYDPVSGEYFVGSMGRSRILRVARDGSYRDFVRNVDGLESSVGLKVDSGRRRLWVCTGRYVLFGGPAGGQARTGVLLFDLDSGELLRQWLIAQPSPTDIFNDLAVAEDGSVYVTTTLLGRVYHIAAASPEMDLLYEAAGRQTNGITFDPEGRFLFFTLDRGIMRMDPGTGATVEVRSDEPEEAGTDGLYGVPGGLVAVQPRRRRIVRLRLSASSDAIVGVDTLRYDHPDFAYPTTGVVVGDTLVFVATSFADRPRQADTADQHGDVIIGRLTLPASSR